MVKQGGIAIRSVLLWFVYIQYILKFENVYIFFNLFVIKPSPLPIIPCPVEKELVRSVWLLR